MYNKESAFFLDNQSMLIPNEDIFSTFLNMEIERHQGQAGDPFDTIFREYREPLPQQKMLVIDKDNIKDEKVNLVNSNAIVKAQFHNPLLLKKRKGGKLFETDRSERKYSCDVELTNDITRKQEKLENQSVISDSSKTIFKTHKEDDECTVKGDPKEMKKMMKLLKNRISARKCRQKKKEYYDSLESKVAGLEKELEKYKNLSKQRNSVESLMELLENKEKEVTQSDKVKNTAKKAEYKVIQSRILFELFRKIIKVIMPIEYNIFVSKFIKVNDIASSDSTMQMMQKIIQNQEILDGIYELKSDLLTHFNLNRGNLTNPQKFFLFLEKLKSFTDNFADISAELNSFEDYK